MFKRQAGNPESESQAGASMYAFGANGLGGLTFTAM
jgi:hypothetical protein